jgi:hypothetical protein
VCCCCFIPILLTELWSDTSQSHVTTDDQSASFSWNKAPIWGLRPDFHYCQTIAGLLIWGATGYCYIEAVRTQQKTACIVEEACLPLGCLAIDILLLNAIVCSLVTSYSDEFTIVVCIRCCENVYGVVA